MMSRVLASLVLLPAALALSACVQQPPLEARVPSMPVVTLPSAAASDMSDDTVIAAAVAAMHAGDATAAAAPFRSIEDRDRRARMAAAVARQLTTDNVVTAVRFAEALPVDQAQGAALEIAAFAWAQRDASAALQWAINLAEPATARVGRVAVADALVATDPRGVIDRLRAMPAVPARDDMLIIVAAAWARRDPDAALAWADSLPVDELRSRLTSAIGFEVAQHDPVRAVSVADMVPAGRNRWLLFSAIGQTWVATDPKAAVAWANRLPAGEPRDAAFAGLNTGLGVRVARRMTGPPGQRALRTRGGGRGFAMFPDTISADFVAWRATQPPGLSRDDAIIEYVRQRGALQPDAVGQWLASLPPGTARDQAMGIYVDDLLIASPAEAARWLKALPRSDRSDDLIEKTARRWLQSNPDAARAWLFEVPLPEDRKQRLLREAPR